MPGGDTQHSVHPFPSVHLALLFNSGLPALSPSLGDRLCLEGRWDPERGREVDWAHGAFLAVRRAAFDEAGGFDPRQWMYAEDLDLGWRLRAAGWTTVYEPGARVAHEVSAAARKAFADERHARHIAAAYDWMTRRRGRLVSRTYAVLNLAGAAARWALLAIPARIAPQRFAPRRARERRYMALHRLGLRRQSGLSRPDSA
jgi:GT2 family glycosyltransferase